ncbi:MULTISPECIES: glycerophosphodiester phosphodiesterase [unclassified Staphylococcus]|uniref:glycerophosphodiester phosphodiesterase n=1 Tax=unclassified Staphylococcus TaxID=91994 RepID=UPI0021CF1122|nr:MULTISPECIES: glycerophosphodiester phosphodiesterase [unclassified Staphylococcus]UXR76985.1 glycerophosphodiester phosphodiesterase [Staphylococcus sp. IVB6233]UXR81111.1 glycerophosphodiester phosphodiesterase [Staphylococcus sp. IVB6218]
MTKTNRVLTGSLVGIASLISGALYITNKNKSIQKREIKPFFTHKAPYVFSHRGGMQERPESTELAFDHSLAMGLTGFETDIRITKDEQVIVFHDATVDRTTNGSGAVSQHTLSELQQLDAGYRFTNINGRKPYQNHPQAKIMTMAALLQRYPDQLVNIDIKDHPNSYEGTIAAERLYKVIKENHAESRVLVTSFYKEQIERFHTLDIQDEIAIGASQHEVTEGILKCYSGLGHLYQGLADTFQMPTVHKGLVLTQRKLISWLNQQNIAPGFYGVNNVDYMVDLANKGVHTLVTDRPTIGKQFLTFYQSN